MSINRCAEIKALLLPYLHGEAARSERALVHAHLGTCRNCQNRLEMLQRAEAQLSRGLNAHALDCAPPAQAWLRLQSALRHEPQPTVLAQRGGLLAQLGCALRRAAPAVTAIAIVAAGLQTFLQSPQVIGIPESTPGAMILAESIAPLPERAHPIQQDRASDALVVRAHSPDVFDLFDLAERSTRVRAPQKLAAPRMTRRSYLLPPISGELIEDGAPIRPCGACGQGDGAASLHVDPSSAPPPAPTAFGRPSFECAACAIQR